MEGFPRLQGLHRGVGEDLGLDWEGGVVADDHPVQPRNVLLGEIAVPVEARRIGGQLSGSHGVIGQLALTALDAVPARFGHLGLEIDHRCGVGLGIRPLGQGQHGFHIGLVLGLGLLEAVLEIIVAVRQADAARAHLVGIVGRVLGVRTDAAAEDRGVGLAVGVAHDLDHVLVGLGVANALQVLLQRRVAHRLDVGLIHEGAIIGADLGRLDVSAATPGGFLEDGVDAVLRQHAQHVEIAEADAVGGNLHRLQRIAVGVFVEVVARLDAEVAGGGVETPGSVVRAGQAGGRCIGGHRGQGEETGGSYAAEPDDLLHGRIHSQGTNRLQRQSPSGRCVNLYHRGTARKVSVL
jgi:hypothetical protein